MHAHLIMLTTTLANVFMHLSYSQSADFLASASSERKKNQGKRMNKGQ